MKGVHKFLTTRIPQINYIRDINYGGCGIFALHLHKNLQKLGVKSQIVGIGWKHTVEAVTEYRTNNNAELIKRTGCAHVVVRYRGKYYDSKGQHNPAIYGQINLLDLKEEELEIMLSRRGNWNDSFKWYNRPTIEKELNNYFNEFKLDPKKAIEFDLF